MKCISTIGDGVIVHIHAVPGARKSEITGLHGNALKVKLHAAPVEGKANKELLAFMATTLGLKKAAVTLLTGNTSREKRILITGLSAEAVKQRLRH